MLFKIKDFWRAPRGDEVPGSMHVYFRRDTLLLIETPPKVDPDFDKKLAKFTPRQLQTTKALDVQTAQDPQNLVVFK